MEWWDAPLLPNETYDDVDNNNINFDLEQESLITPYVQHPVPIEPPVEGPAPAPKPVMLTEKERKKLRRQNRMEAHREKQDKIRMGLLPPEQPKVKITNLMRVLGREAVSDPTLIEQQVRKQMQDRQEKHRRENEERRVPDDIRKQRKREKLREDGNGIIHVAVFR